MRVDLRKIRLVWLLLVLFIISRLVFSVKRLIYSLDLVGSKNINSYHVYFVIRCFIEKVHIYLGLVGL